MKEIYEIVVVKGLLIVEDVCYVFGGLYDYFGNEFVGSCFYFDLLMFFFYLVKIIVMVEGGVVIINFFQLVCCIIDFRNYGIIWDVDCFVFDGGIDIFGEK